MTTPKIEVPDGWEIEREIEGGQPNGIGEIESSNYREWYTDTCESHHRTVITLYGPWEEGPTESARQMQVWEQERRVREAAEREERTLREAAEILARRAAL